MSFCRWGLPVAAADAGADSPPTPFVQRVAESGYTMDGLLGWECATTCAVATGRGAACAATNGGAEGACEGGGEAAEQPEVLDAHQASAASVEQRGGGG